MVQAKEVVSRASDYRDTGAAKEGVDGAAEGVIKVQAGVDSVENAVAGQVWVMAIWDSVVHEAGDCLVAVM